MRWLSSAEWLGGAYGMQIKNIIKRQLSRKQVQGVKAMKNQNTTQVQAILNLLYIGDDDDLTRSRHDIQKREFRVLNDNHNKIKSNTIHLRTTKNIFGNQNYKTQSLEQSLQYTKHSAQNKENLKKILKKLESSPSPPRKKKEQANHRQMQRIQTQNSEIQIKAKSNHCEHKSLQFTKKSLDKLLDRRKEKDFMKSLIKAKIVEKLKKIQSKQSSKKKMSHLQGKMQTIKGSDGNFGRHSRPSVVRSGKSRQLRSNFINLLQEQRKMNNPVLSRKSCKLTVKQLLW